MFVFNGNFPSLEKCSFSIDQFLQAWKQIFVLTFWLFPISRQCVWLLSENILSLSNAFELGLLSQVGAMLYTCQTDFSVKVQVDLWFVVTNLGIVCVICELLISWIGGQLVRRGILKYGSWIFPPYTIMRTTQKGKIKHFTQIHRLSSIISYVEIDKWIMEVWNLL